MLYRTLKKKFLHKWQTCYLIIKSYPCVRNPKDSKLGATLRNLRHSEIEIKRFEHEWSN